MSHPDQSGPADHARPGGYDEDPVQNPGPPGQAAGPAPAEQQAGPQSVGPQNAGPQNAGPQSAGPQNAGPQNAGPQNAGPQNGPPYGAPQPGPGGPGGGAPGGGAPGGGAPGGGAPGGGASGGHPGAHPGPPDRGSVPPGEPGGDRHAGNGGSTIIDPQRAEHWRAQWEDVRMMFVDQPHDAVARADGLVGEVLDELARTFTQQRSALDPNAVGDPSTEEMRRAVQRYREFFDRLLTL